MQKNILSVWREYFRFCYTQNSEVIITGVKKPMMDVQIPSMIGNCPVVYIAKGAFEGNAMLCSVSIPSTVKEIGRCAFVGCRNLSQVVIANEAVVIDDTAFVDCDGLADSQGFVVVNGILFEHFGNQENIIIPKGVTHISPYAFRWNQNSRLVKSITLPSTITHITREELCYCFNLEHIYIS